MRLASYRLAALGTDTALMQYLPALARHESPFLAQVDEVRAFIASRRAGRRRSTTTATSKCCSRSATTTSTAIRRRSREAGVSVDLVFLLARIEQIDRAAAAAARARTAGAEARDGRPSARRADRDRLFPALVRQENRRNSVRDLFRGTTELLARRVTEQASRSGEHYITASRGEFVAMYRAAAGAGFIIAVHGAAQDSSSRSSTCRCCGRARPSA